MNREEWRIYNKNKQKEYRDKARNEKAARGEITRPYIKSPTYWDKFTPVEEIFRRTGHCTYCGMLLSSEYHKQHPLIGCQKAQKRMGSSVARTSVSKTENQGPSPCPSAYNTRSIDSPKRE